MELIRGMDLTKLSKAELIVLIYRLVDEIEALKVRIIDLEKKVAAKETSTSGKKELPAFVKLNVKKKKSGKRKKRVQGYVRMKDKPTHQVFHSHAVCPDCGGELGKPSVAYSRTIIDIPITAATVTEHVVFKRYCFSCHQRTYPTPELSSYVVGKNRIGINLMGLITTMKEELRLPIDQIQHHLKIFYLIKMSAGEIVRILQETAMWGKTEYEAIKTQLLKSPFMHADETGGRENGKNGYFWNFSTDMVQYVLYRKSRGNQVVVEVVGKDGKDYEGVMVSDFYTAYNTYLGFHQRCWVHYLRDIHKLKEEYPDDKILKRWAKDVHNLYERAKVYTGPPADTPVGLAAALREKKEAEFKRALIVLCEPYLRNATVFSTLAARGTRYISELFTFIRFPGIASDNNPAERAVRHLVVARKISGGTRSEKGSETKSILTSLFGTWRLQHLNPFEQTKLLLLSQAVCQEP